MKQTTILDNNAGIFACGFPGTGLPAYVIIQGLIVIWDRVLDPRKEGNNPE